MRILLFVFPIALLVAYSQIVVKWCMLGADAVQMQNLDMFQRILKYFSNPVILSAYAAALLASFVWLYVIARLPLVVAFPVYIGITFLLVVIGGWIFLSENVTAMRIVSILLILIGIILGVRD